MLDRLTTDPWHKGLYNLQICRGQKALCSPPQAPTARLERQPGAAICDLLRDGLDGRAALSPRSVAGATSRHDTGLAAWPELRAQGETCNHALLVHVAPQQERVQASRWTIKRLSSF
jgi:hypothetical protein